MREKYSTKGVTHVWIGRFLVVSAGKIRSVI